jgi:hypothetical protein
MRNADKENAKTLNSLHEKLVLANKQSTLLFLGDNIYPKGMPQKKIIDYEIAHNKLQNQKFQKFQGKTIFIPGNHDWYNGIKGLERQENKYELL